MPGLHPGGLACKARPHPVPVAPTLDPLSGPGWWWWELLLILWTLKLVPVAKHIIARERNLEEGVGERWGEATDTQHTQTLKDVGQ